MNPCAHVVDIKGLGRVVGGNPSVEEHLERVAEFVAKIAHRTDVDGVEGS